MTDFVINPVPFDCKACYKCVPLSNDDLVMRASINFTCQLRRYIKLEFENSRPVAIRFINGVRNITRCGSGVRIGCGKAENSWNLIPSLKTMELLFVRENHNILFSEHKCTQVVI